MADQTGNTAQLNLTKAVNNLGETYLYVQGKNTAQALPGNTSSLVLSGQGRLARVSVTAIGGNATNGTIYDAAIIGCTSRPIYTILANATLGVTDVNLPVSYGIVAALGVNMTATVSYSPAPVTT